MSRTYSFEFLGTRNMFLETLNQYPTENHKSFYFNDYIVEVSSDNYYFGVARGGHSGGYWFRPTITEMDNKLIFNGKIEYIDSYSNDKGYKKIINKFEEVCMLVFLFPLFIFFKIYLLIKILIKLIRKQPIIKEETNEDRLVYLMKNLLNCIHK